LSKNSLFTLLFFLYPPNLPLYIAQNPGPIRPLGDSSFRRFNHKCPGYDSSFGRFVHPKPQATRSSRFPLYQINYIKINCIK
ncbi:hypothetical protein C1645_775953, partial [Glomus cerebriforme]